MVHFTRIYIALALTVGCLSCSSWALSVPATTSSTTCSSQLRELATQLDDAFRRVFDDNKVVSQASRIISGTGHVVSCPARMHLPARNSLVNEVEFLGLNVVMTNEIVRLVIIM